MVGGWLPDLEEPFAEVHGGDEDETIVPNPFGDEYYDVLEWGEEAGYTPGCKYDGKWPSAEPVSSDLVQVEQRAGKEASPEESQGEKAEIKHC